MYGTTKPLSERHADTRMDAPQAVLWDMDGTLIDSDPYWLQAERETVIRAGGRWDDAVAQRLQGASLPVCAAILRDCGVTTPQDELIAGLVSAVREREMTELPWLPGAMTLLSELAAAAVPSVLVTGSPRAMAANVIAHAPAGAFVGYVCGENDLPHKPNPAPYLKAVDIASQTTGTSVDITRCVAFEDSRPGLVAAAAAGAATVAVTRCARVLPDSDGPQTSCIRDYDGLTVNDLARFVETASAARPR